VDRFINPRGIVLKLKRARQKATTGQFINITIGINANKVIGSCGVFAGKKNAKSGTDGECLC